MISFRLALFGILLLIAFVQAHTTPEMEETQNLPIATSNNDTSEPIQDESTKTDEKRLTGRQSRSKKTIYDHHPLSKLSYQFKSDFYEIPVTSGKVMNFSFPHLAPLLHHESNSRSWIVVFFHIPSWPLTSLMLPRVDYVAQQFPNITFLSVDCSNVSSMALLHWDLVGLPSFVIYNSLFNLADHTGSATSSTLTLLLKTFTEIEPIKIDKPDFDDITLRTDDLPRFDPKLAEYLFALFWGLRWLLSKTAMLGPLLNF
jgi:hypothetical protein